MNTRATPLGRSVADLLERASNLYGDKTALSFEGERFSFNELNDQASRLAAGLLELGVSPGKTVALYSPNCREWVVAYYAVMKLGAVVTPLNLMLTPKEAAYAMSDCGAVAVLGSDDRIEGLTPVLAQTRLRICVAWGENPPARAVDFAKLVRHELDDKVVREDNPDKPCTIGYTSGTTGHPKGAVLTHRAILMNTAMTATMHMRTSADTVVSALPCSHVYGNIVMNAAIAYGMTLVLHRSFDAERVLRSIQEHRATMLEGVPTMYMYLLNSPALNDFDLTSLTRCTVGGQTMPRAKMEQVEATFGCPLIELWGMTELGGLGTTHSVYGPTRHGSIGVPLPHMEARIVSTDGTRRVLPPDEVGELQMRGPVVMREYLNRPEATAEALDAEGWLSTGDLAQRDEGGHLYVVDRLKDMIITGGFNIYPAELERVIAEHPDVAMVAVGSVPNEQKGELAKAYIVVRQGRSLDAASLDQHCRQRLAAYKVPRLYQFVDDLPKTSTGKVMRRMLRELDR